MPDSEPALGWRPRTRSTSGAGRMLRVRLAGPAPYAVAAALAVLSLRLVTPRDVASVFTLTWDATLTLVALMILSRLLAEAGLFRWAAWRAVRAFLSQRGHTAPRGTRHIGGHAGDDTARSRRTGCAGFARLGERLADRPTAAKPDGDRFIRPGAERPRPLAA